MKLFVLFVSMALALPSILSGTEPIHLDKLTVLYIGDSGTPRADAFEQFLRNRVALVKTARRSSFERTEADSADVVLLDWPQSGAARAERAGRAPLGERGSWTKPTVLLGSAGLNLAVAWKVRGGSG